MATIISLKFLEEITSNFRKFVERNPESGTWNLYLRRKLIVHFNRDLSSIIYPIINKGKIPRFKLEQINTFVGPRYLSPI
ncbi:MAG: hypothetical protein IPM92_17175 [Saprospiraceae bacterium]|nr:hypothetical protein [Saprospiraceae bacterium]